MVFPCLAHAFALRCDGVSEQSRPCLSLLLYSLRFTGSLALTAFVESWACPFYFSGFIYKVTISFRRVRAAAQVGSPVHAPSRPSPCLLQTRYPLPRLVEAASGCSSHKHDSATAPLWLEAIFRNILLAAATAGNWEGGSTQLQRQAVGLPAYWQQAVWRMGRRMGDRRLVRWPSLLLFLLPAGRAGARSCSVAGCRRNHRMLLFYRASSGYSLSGR